MNQLSKLIILSLMFALALNSTFGQRPIEISIDPNNDTLLVLSDGGETELGNVIKRRVLWIKNDPNILSFQIVPKHGPSYPFVDNPTQPHGPRVNATVRFLGPTGDWHYNIKWRTRDHEYNYDPKIAVKPINPIIQLIILLGLIIISFTSIVFYRKWQKAERLLKNRPQNT